MVFRLFLKLFFLYGYYNRRVTKTVKVFRSTLIKEGLGKELAKRLSVDFESNIRVDIEKLLFGRGIN